MRRGNESKKVQAFQKNVKYLAKYRGDGTMGSLESYAGVYRGYLSRNLSIPLAVAIKISEYLEVGLDALTDPNMRFEVEAKRAVDKMHEQERQKLSITDTGV